MDQRVLQQRRVAANVPVDPIGFWLSRVDVDTRPAHKSHFLRWMKWLNSQPGWAGVTPRDLLVRQIEAVDPYVVLDLIQAYVNSLVLRKSSKRKAYSVVRSFFAHNRCNLPVDSAFQIRGDRPPVQAKLTVNDILEAFHAATVRDKSIIMVKWQSFLDAERLEYVNLNCGQQIVEQMQTGVCPVRIDIAVGRKSNENDLEGAFYTFIGKDAVDSLEKYFEEQRGWPKAGEPIWLQLNRTTINKDAIGSMWLRLLRHMGKIPKHRGPAGSRYGYGMHEFRDEATTWLHTHAKADGFDMDCVKFFCGQVGEIDPLKYNKFYRDADYVRKHYAIAEKHLNIVTRKPAESGPADVWTALKDAMQKDPEGARIFLDFAKGLEVRQK